MLVSSKLRMIPQLSGVCFSYKTADVADKEKVSLWTLCEAKKYCQQRSVLIDSAATPLTRRSNWKRMNDSMLKLKDILLRANKHWKGDGNKWILSSISGILRDIFDLISQDIDVQLLVSVAHRNFSFLWILSNNRSSELEAITPFLLSCPISALSCLLRLDLCPHLAAVTRGEWLSCLAHSKSKDACRGNHALWSGQALGTLVMKYPSD